MAACWHLYTPMPLPLHFPFVFQQSPFVFGAPHGNPKVSGKLLGPRKTNLTRKVHGHFCSCYAKLVDLPAQLQREMGRVRQRKREREKRQATQSEREIK